MVFRAIVSGGALDAARAAGALPARRHLAPAPQPARARRRRTPAEEQPARLVELPQLLADAQRAGQLPAVDHALRRELAREFFVRELFAASHFGARWHAMRAAQRVPLRWRLRLFVYAACPALLAPFFALKRWSAPR